MTGTATLVLAITLVTAAAAAELNLMRVFLSDWRMARHARRRRRLRPPSTRGPAAQASPLTRGLTWAGRATFAAALTASSAAAEVSAGAFADEGGCTTQLTPAPAAEPALSSADTLAEPTISTDRPSFSDGTGIQPLWRLNLETGYTFTFRDRDDQETQRHNAPEVLARIGIIEDRLELRIFSSGYAWSRTNNGNGYSSSQGWSDIALGVKLKLIDQNGAVPRLALGAQTTIGAGADAVSTQIAEPALKLLWSYDLGQALGDEWKSFTLGGNANIAWPTSGGERFAQGQGSVYLSFPLAESLSGFTEYYVIGPNSKGADAAHYTDVGVTYMINSRVQLDARVGLGLNDEADNAFTGLGVSVLY